MPRQDERSWRLGHEHGLKGCPSRCPARIDTLAYAAGFIEGAAERKRNIESSAIGLLPDGPVNVVERGSPRGRRPKIVD